MSQLRFFPALWALLLAAAIALPSAQTPSGPPTPVAWTIAASGKPKPAVPGGRIEVAVRATVERGWYIYAMTQPAGGPTPLRITLAEGQPFTVAGPVGGPEPKRAWDSAFEIESAKHDGTVTFTVPVEIGAGAASGPATLALQVRYQACSDTLCLRPKTETLSLPLEIAAGASRPTGPSTP